MFNPEKDGIDHINVYSKGKTELGQFLTNFSYSPINIEDGDGKFISIEGYWYWLSCKDDMLRNLHGWKAKEYGRKVNGLDWSSDYDFQKKILYAIDIKLRTNPVFLKKLVNCKLPLVHYYVYGNKVVEPSDGQWILDHLSSYQEIEYDI